MTEQERKLETWKGIRTICMLSLGKKYSHLSDGAVANKIGISKPTLNRIKNDENNIPTPDNIVKLLAGSESKGLVWKAMELINGRFKVMAEEAMREDRASLDGKTLETLEMQALFAKRDNFIVYELTSLKKGASKDQILRVLGDKGLKAADALLKRNLIFQEKDRFHAYDKSILVRNNEALKRQLKIYLDFYDPSLFTEEHGNSILAFSEGLNENGLKLLQEEFAKHYNKLEEIYRDPKNSGKLLSFCGSFCDVLDRAV